MNGSTCTTPQGSGQACPDNPSPEKTPGSRDHTDDEEFLPRAYRWTVAEFRTPKGSVFLPPGVALNDRLFAQVMAAV